MRKAALIVDDSRVAMATLRRLLEPHHMAIDSAESGEEAIEYLRSNVPPAVVFLDHMMPGMDGFQVLGRIKKDSRLAAVPVVMYTSQEGEAYMGQALARGAFAVLSKPPSPLSLLRILEQLRLTEEPAVTRSAATEPVAASAAARVSGSPGMPPSRAASLPTARPIPAPEESRPLGTPATPARAQQSEAMPPVEDAAHAGWSPIWVVIYTLLLLAPALWLLQQYRASEHARAELVAANRALQARVVAAAATSAVNAAESSASALSTERWAEALTWAVNLHNQYGHDQLPLDDHRLALVRELVARLTRAGFKGVVRVETHVGEFCLARDGFGGFKLPEPATPIADCEIVDYTAEQATTLGRRQSPAFSRYLVTQANARTPVRVEAVSHGNERPLVRYPDVSALRTAGEWNSIAGRNQRVRIVVVPSEE